MHKQALFLSSISAFAAMAVLPASVQAQANAPQAMNEIIVTARKRDEALSDVPVSVVAISQQKLENNLTTDILKVSELAPQVKIGKGNSGTGAIITMRGISTTPTDGALDQSVSLVFDGVQLSRGKIIGATLFDVQQVEVMQGPQALYFGKNSPAGVIAITSAGPTDELEGYIRAGYEIEARERFAEGAISGPLSETFGARLAFRFSKMDGWNRNVAEPVANPFQPGVPVPGAVHGDRMPYGKEYAGRLTLNWSPSSDFEAEAKLMINEHRGNGRTSYGETFCIGSTTTPTQFGVTIPFDDCRINGVTADSSVPAEFARNWPAVDTNDGVLYDRARFIIGSLNITKSFGALELASTTGYYDQNESGSFNADYSSYAQALVPSRHDYRQFTQELRLSSNFDGQFNFMVGGYFEDGHRYWVNAPDLLHTYDPVADTYADIANTSSTDTESYSVFGALTFDITPELELSGGLRYSHDKKEAVLVNIYVNPNSVVGGLRPVGDALFPVFEDDDVSPEVTLSWRPAPGHMVFGAYKTGYKAGGIANDALLSIAADKQSVLFGPESAEGFEVGYKGALLNRALRLDVTAYHYIYDGLQVSSYDIDLLRNRILNAAKVRTTGMSATMQYDATDRLSFNGNFGYNDAEYKSFENAPCYSGQTEAEGCVGGFQDHSGKTPNRAPKVTFTLGGNYEADISEGWTANVSASASYSSSFQTNTDYAPGGLQDSYWLVNAAVRLAQSEDNGFEFAVIGRNLTNTRYMLYNFQQPFTGNSEQYFGVFNRPREVVLQASYRF